MRCHRRIISRRTRFLAESKTEGAIGVCVGYGIGGAVGLDSQY
ncbi:hypothetical protein [Bartonella henselae]|nr:hypothetical protein [Bartonella henselae]MDM9987041.1 hypothetical protein [Bartonella henselae]